MKLGITATRSGQTRRQKRVVVWLFKEYYWSEFHHGDCLGGDEEGFNIAKAAGVRTFAHPPINEKFRAFTKSDVILPQKDFIERNHYIVDSVNVMIACPASRTEQFRGSGTWATIRYARKVGRPLVLVWPDGEISFERCEKLLHRKPKAH